MTVVDKYPEVFSSVSHEALDRSAELVESLTRKGVAEWADGHVVTRELGGQAYRMVLDYTGSDQTLLLLGEFGNGINVGAVSRLLTMRALINPDANIVLQPNTTFGEDNMNFSRDEKRQLRSGATSPIVDRVRDTVDSIGDTGSLVVYGPSQGGTVALAYAAHQDTQPMATAVMEVPTVVNRSSAKLANDFIGSAGDIKENIRDNFEGDSPFSDELIRGLGVAGTMKFFLGLPKTDNLSLAGIMRHDDAGANMERILNKRGSVVHAWATGDAVSPVEANRALRDILSPLYGAQYSAFEIENDHSIANNYFINAALAHRALTQM